MGELPAKLDQHMQDTYHYDIIMSEHFNKYDLKIKDCQHEQKTESFTESFEEPLEKLNIASEISNVSEFDISSEISIVPELDFAANSSFESEISDYDEIKNTINHILENFDKNDEEFILSKDEQITNDTHEFDERKDISNIDERKCTSNNERLPIKITESKANTNRRNRKPTKFFKSTTCNICGRIYYKMHHLKKHAKLVHEKFHTKVKKCKVVLTRVKDVKGCKIKQR